MRVLDSDYSFAALILTPHGRSRGGCRSCVTWGEALQEVGLQLGPLAVGDDEGDPVLAQPRHRPQPELHQEVDDGQLTLA